MFRRCDGTSHLLTFALVCCPFSLSGLCNGMIDVLNKYFQNSLHVSKAQSALVRGSGMVEEYRQQRNRREQNALADHPDPPTLNEAIHMGIARRIPWRGGSVDFMGPGNRIVQLENGKTSKFLAPRSLGGSICGC